MGSLAILFCAEPVRAEKVRAELVRAETSENQHSVYLEVEGNCPDRETVAHELLPLLDRWEFSESAERSQEVVRVVDHGHEMEISALGDVRKVSDPNNDCQERARVAAVFIALRLEPAVTSDDETPPSSSGTEDPRAATPTRPDEPLKIEIELGGLALRSMDGPIGWTAGPLLGFGISKGGVLGSLSAGVTSRAETEEESVALWFQRVPLDLGLGYSFSRGSWTLTPLLSVAVDSLRVRAHNLEDATTQSRLEVGPRLSLRVARRFGPTRLFGAARFSWFPRDYAVHVEPLGEVMRTPRLWFGTSAGLVFDFPRR